MKKKLGILTTLSVIALAACGQTEGETTEPLKLASLGSDYEIWQYIDDEGIDEEAGIELEVIDMSGKGTLNEVVAKGDVDANAFQSLSFMKVSNEESGSEPVVPVAVTYMEPMGIYSDKVSDVSDLPDNGEVSIPLDPSNVSRALLLLQAAGVITLNDDVEGLYTVRDIADNPKNLTFTEIDDTAVPRTVPDVAAAIFGNTVGMDAGFNVIEDAIFVEEPSEDNIENYNVIVTREELKNDERIQKLGELYHNDKVQDFIDKEFKKSKIELNVSIDEMEGKY